MTQLVHNPSEKDAGLLNQLSVYYLQIIPIVHRGELFMVFTLNRSFKLTVSSR